MFKQCNPTQTVEQGGNLSTVALRISEDAESAATSPRAVARASLLIDQIESEYSAAAIQVRLQHHQQRVPVNRSGGLHFNDVELEQQIQIIVTVVVNEPSRCDRNAGARIQRPPVKKSDEPPAPQGDVGPPCWQAPQSTFVVQSKGDTPQKSFG